MLWKSETFNNVNTCWTFCEFSTILWNHVVQVKQELSDNPLLFISMNIGTNFYSFYWLCLSRWVWVYVQDFGGKFCDSNLEPMCGWQNKAHYFKHNPHWGFRYIVNIICFVGNKIWCALFAKGLPCPNLTFHKFICFWKRRGTMPFPYFPPILFKILYSYHCCNW